MGSRVVISEAVVSADLGGEAILLNVETGIYFGLDPVGSTIWNLLARGATSDDIVRRLLDEYDVAEGPLRADVAGFIDTLEAKGLATIVEH